MSNIKLGGIVGGNNTSKIDKLIETLRVLPINADKKSAMIGLIENLDFIGGYLQCDSACFSY